MLIAGPCLFTDISEKQDIIDTAKSLVDVVDIFRCKVYGGGTSPEKYMMPHDESRLEVLAKINKDIMPVATECHLPDQAIKCQNIGIKNIWIGARNSANYSLLEQIAPFKGDVFIKRGTGMTIDEVIGLFDIMCDINNKTPYIIERGINTFDRLPDSRWSADLKGVIRIKHERKDIFDKLIVDVSHCNGRHEYIADTYNAFHSIGVKHFMFECTLSGKSKTDQRQMISVEKLKEIIK